MAKLRLTPDPTFKAKVGIPVPGKPVTPVEFTFRWRTATEVETWWEEVKERPLVELIPTMATAWELDDEFNDENIARLCSVYLGAADAIFKTYLDELRGARAKN
jgi:hypothetical protein